MTGFLTTSGYSGFEGAASTRLRNRPWQAEADWFTVASGTWLGSLTGVKTTRNVTGGVGGYVYDQFGRQTTIPAVDAPNLALGAITLSYYDDDLPEAITQGGTAAVFTLDAAGKAIVHKGIGYAVATLAVTTATALCAGSLGVGCVVIASVGLDMLGGVPANVIAAKVMHEKITSAKAISWYIGLAFGPAVRGYSVKTKGAPPLKDVAKKIRGR